MALAKTGYTDAVKGKVSEKVGIKADGTIATEGETATGKVKFTLNNANAANDLTTNHNVLKAFMDFAGGTIDSLTNTFNVSWTADGTQANEL